MKKKSRRLRKRLVATLSTVLVIIVLVLTYLFTDLFVIRTYDIEGINDESKQVLIQKVRRLESGQTLGIFPANKIFTYSRGKMEELILETVPTTRSLSIYPENVNTLRISITQETSVFRKNDTYGMNVEGKSYREMRDISSLPILTYASSSQVTPEMLSGIYELYPKISLTLFPVTDIYIDTYNDIYFKNEKRHVYVVVSKSSDTKKIWSTLLSAIDTDPLKEKLRTSKLQYLDARFGNKIFYRFTNGSEETIIDTPRNNIATTSHATTTR